MGVKTLVFQMAGDSIVGEDRNYLFPPDLQYPVTYLILTANVLLPLYYPSYNPQVGLPPAYPYILVRQQQPRTHACPLQVPC